MTHLLYSQDEEMPIKFFDKFDKAEIKKAIIEHLKSNPEDILEHCKDSKTTPRKYYGYDIINFYGVNPKTNKVSLIYLKYNRQYYKSLEDE